MFRGSVHFFRRPEFVLGPLALQIADHESGLPDVPGFRSFLPSLARPLLFISKPNSLLRVKLSAQAQWPEAIASVSCPEIQFPDEVSNVIGVLGVINEMVGDLERIQRYPALGYQVAHELPARILDNWRHLIKNGFTSHLMANPYEAPAAGGEGAA